MKLLDDHNDIREKIFEYFGYVENWRVLPLDDARNMYWQIVNNRVVRFAEDEARLIDVDEGDYYENEIYTQRHLRKWVYRGPEYTMIVVDTHTDGNQFLQIFTNANERPMEEKDNE